MTEHSAGCICHDCLPGSRTPPVRVMPGPPWDAPITEAEINKERRGRGDAIHCDTCGAACARIAGIPWEALGLEDSVTITCAGCDPELSFDSTVAHIVADRLEQLAEELRR